MSIYRKNHYLSSLDKIVASSPLKEILVTEFQCGWSQTLTVVFPLEVTSSFGFYSNVSRMECNGGIEASLIVEYAFFNLVVLGHGGIYCSTVS